MNDNNKLYITYGIALPIMGVLAWLSEAFLSVAWITLIGAGIVLTLIGK